MGTSSRHDRAAPDAPAARTACTAPPPGAAARAGSSACDGARLAACALVAAAATVAVGCEDDAALWGDAMSPTQMQRADQGPAPTGNMFTTSGGDSEDPFVDNANYPFVQGPWWSNPAYNGG